MPMWTKMSPRWATRPEKRMCRREGGVHIAVRAFRAIDDLGYASLAVMP
jgi:hypothetical protein